MTPIFVYLSSSVLPIFSLSGGADGETPQEAGGPQGGEGVAAARDCRQQHAGAAGQLLVVVWTVSVDFHVYMLVTWLSACESAIEDHFCLLWHGYVNYWLVERWTIIGWFRFGRLG